MKIYTMVEGYELNIITCDKCGKETTQHDPMELQEYYCIEFIGGYSSVFGDESHVECDLCQHCLKKMIGDFCRVTE